MSTASYLVEVYVPRNELAGRAQTIARARGAAKAMTVQGTPVRYVRSIFIPTDETCFHLFAGPSPEAISEVSRRAGLDYGRIVEVLQ